MENTYNIKTYDPWPDFFDPFLPENRKVTFTAGAPYALLSRHLLELHAAVARVLHLTGMGDKVDGVQRMRGDIRCLASDGSTDVEALLLFV